MVNEDNSVRVPARLMEDGHADCEGLEFERVWSSQANASRGLI